jgi:hypothetical protein
MLDWSKDISRFCLDDKCGECDGVGGVSYVYGV